MRTNRWRASRNRPARRRRGRGTGRSPVRGRRGPGRGRCGRRSIDSSADDGLDLVGPQHAVLVEGVAGVVEQVRVGGRGDGGAVVGLEGGADLLGVVAEVEDERAVLVRVDPVEPGQRLHGVQARRAACRRTWRRASAGRSRSGTSRRRRGSGTRRCRTRRGSLRLGDAVELRLGDVVAVDRRAVPENATSTPTSV